MSGWIDRSGWIHCPTCGNKTRTKVNPDTILKRFPLFCPKCGAEHIVDVQGQNIILSEPDAKTQSR
ncbi:cysteine-rich KTR domain-containing protein [Lawsonibacter asaccharolyticus]